MVSVRRRSTAVVLALVMALVGSNLPAQAADGVTAAAVPGRVTVHLQAPTGYQLPAGLPALDLSGIKGELFSEEFYYDATSDAAGDLDFEGVEPGSYILEVDSPVSSDLLGGEWVDGHLVSDQVGQLTVDAGGRTVTATYSRGAVLRGQVVGPDGTPVAGAKVRSTTLSESGISDSDGAFALGLRAGEWQVSVTAPDDGDLVGGAWVSDSSPVSTSWNQAGSVQVGSDLSVSPSTVTMRLVPGAVVTGTVTGADGQPAAGATVRVGVRSAHTDAGGAYRVGGLGPGTYTVQVAPSDDYQVGGFVMLDGRVTASYDPSWSYESARQLTLAGSEQVSGVDASLGLGGAVDVRVSGLPAGTTVWVAASRDSSGIDQSGVSDGAAVTFRGLTAGTWTVSAYAAGANGVDPDNQWVIADQSVDVRAGETTSLTLTASAAGSISGAVSDPAGASMTSGTVTATAADGTAYTGSVGTDGTFRVTGLPDGSYQVDVESTSGAVVVDSVRVADGQETDLGALRLQAPGGSTVHVVDTSGSPLTGVSVWLYAGSVSRSATTDAAGDATFTGLAAGTYSLWATASGYQRADATATVTAGATTPVTVTLQSAASLTLTVDHAGTPVTARDVVLMDTAGAQHPATTDGSGRATFDGLAPGRYQAVLPTTSAATPVWAGSVRSDWFDLVAGAQSTQVDLDPRYAIDVAVVGSGGGPATGATVSLELLGSGGGSVSATVDSSGSVHLDGLVPGSYRVSAPLDGVTVYAGGTTDASSAPVVDLTAASPTASTRIDASSFTAVAGTLEDSAGAPVAGERVVLESDGQNGKSLSSTSVTSGADGTYRTLVATGTTYRALLGQDGTSTLLPTAVSGSFTASPMTVDLVGTRGVSVSGVVRGGTTADPTAGTDPVPVGGAAVQATSDGTARTATTAADGSFTLTGLDQSALGSVSVAGTGYLMPSAAPLASGVTLRMTLGGRVSGHVTVAGADSAAPAWLQLTDGGGASTRTSIDVGPQGSDYTTDVLPAGTYSAQFGADGQPSQFYDGAATADQATAVRVVPGSTTTGVDARIGELTEVRGTTTAGGVLFQGVTLTLSQADATVATTTSDAMGAYRFAHLAAGGYHLRASYGGYPDIADADVVVSAGQSAVQDLDAAPSSIRYLLRLEVSTSDGQPYNGTARLDDSWCYGQVPTFPVVDGIGQSTSLGCGGTAYIQLAAGTTGRYADGFVSTAGPLIDGTSSADPSLLSVEGNVWTGPVRTVVKATAEVPATVTGVVTDRTGAAVPGATVSVGSIKATTASDGTYSLTGVRPGQRTVVASDGSTLYQDSNASVTLTPAQNATVNLTMVPYGILDARVVDVDGNPVPGVVVDAEATDGDRRVGTTGADGSVEVRGLRDEDYAVRFVGPGDHDIAAYLGGATTAAQSTTVHAVPGQTVTVGQTLTRTADLDVSLDVRDAIDPNESVHVDLLDPTSGTVVASSSPVATGITATTVGNVAPGRYLVRLSGGYFPTVYLTAVGQTSDQTQATPVTFRGDGAALSRTITLQRDWASSSTTLSPTPPATISWGGVIGFTTQVAVTQAGRAGALTTELLVDGTVTDSVSLSSSGATYPDFTVRNLSVGGHHVEVRTLAAGALTGSSASFDVTVVKATPVLDVEVPAQVAYGSALSLRVGASISPVGGQTTGVGGAGQIVVDGNRQDLTLGAAPTTVDLPALPVGSHHVSVTLLATDTTTAATAEKDIEVVPAPTTVDVAPASATVDYGGSTTLSVAVRGGASTPTGSVSAELSGTTLVSAPLVDGAAQLTLTGAALGAGDHDVQIRYGGSDTLGQSAATVHISVSGVPTAVTLDGLPATVAYGAPITLTVGVQAADGTVPGGQVTLSLGDQVVAATLHDGTATATLSGLLDPGAQHLTATFAAAGPLLGVAASADVQVVAAAADLSVDQPTDATFGSATSVAVHVRSVTGVDATGQVRALVDGVELARANLAAGAATLVLPGSVPVGPHQLVVVYDGSDRVLGVTSAGLTWRMGDGPPTVTTMPSASVLPLGAAGAAFHLGVAATGDGMGALSYRVWFGDGSDPITGPYTGALSLDHTYAAVGTYLVRTEVTSVTEDATFVSVQVDRVVVYRDEPLTAVAGDPQSSVVGTAVWLDASASRPSAVIDVVTWDFGDGSNGSGWQVQHTYSVPGTYTATLTVAHGAQTATATTTVTVAAVSVSGGVDITVRSAAGLLQGAQVVYVAPDGTRTAAATGSDGVGTLMGLPDGAATVSVWADGYTPTQVQVLVTGGAGQADVTLASGQIASTVLEQKQLTPQEIQAAGIDVADPANTQVYQAQVDLHFVPLPTETVPAPTPYVVNWGILSTGTVKLYSWHCSGDCGGTTGGTGGTSGGAAGYTATPTIQVVDGHPVLQWLVVPLHASWLKQMVKVSLVVTNLTSDGFTFAGGQARLDLPAGLSLAPMIGAQQSLSQGVPDIPSQGSATVDWYVRGDVENHDPGYTVSADYSAVVSPVGVPLAMTATSTSPIVIWGASALSLTADVEWYSTQWSAYRIRLTLRNVTPADGGADVVNLHYGLENPASGQSGSDAKYVYAPKTQLDQQVADLPAGQSVDWTFTMYTSLGSDDPNFRTMLLDTLKSAVVKTGGDVTLTPTLASMVEQPQAGLSGQVFTDTEPNTYVLTWDKVDGASSYSVYTRDSINDSDPNSWRLLVDSTTDTIAPFRPGDLGLGRYFTVVANVGDAVEADYPLVFGPATYVALGDSFSSGEGVPDFVSGTDTDRQGSDPTDVTQWAAKLLDPTSNTCHRSESGSYPAILSANADLDLGVSQNVACSGAIADDVTSPNVEQFDVATDAAVPAQDDALSGFTRTVTLTMGGNDADFSEVAKACMIDLTCDVVLGWAPIAGAFQGWLSDVVNFHGSVMQGLKDSWNVAKGVFDCGADVEGVAGGDVIGLPKTLEDCASAVKEAVKAYRDAEDPQRVASIGHAFSTELQTRLLRAYEAVLDKAPSAIVYVGTYPTFFDDAGKGVTCHVSPIELLGDIGYEDREDLNYFVREIDNDIRLAAESANASASGRGRVVVVDSDSTMTQKLCVDGSESGTSMFNPVLVGSAFSWSGAYDSQSFSLHPNASGQRAYAKAFEAAMVQTQHDVTLRADQESESTFEVSAGTAVIRAQAQNEGASFTMDLVGPDGTVHDGSGGSSTLTSVGGTLALTVPNPSTGTWTIRVRPAAQGFKAELATVGARLMSALDMSTTVEQSGSTAQWTTVQISAPQLAKVVPTAVGTATVQADGSVDFDASGSTSAASAEWEFPDGTTATGTTVNHVFAAGVPAQATLTVTSADGIVDQADVSATGAPTAHLFPIGQVTVAGAAAVGHDLTATAPSWYPAATSVAYQWLRDNQPIAGATSAAYTVTAADVGHPVSVRVTGSASGYVDSTLESAALTAVSDAAVVEVHASSGSLPYGQTLTVHATASRAGQPAAGEQVELLIDGDVLTTGTTAADGSADLSAPALALGTHDLVVRLVDAAGQVDSAALAVDVVAAPSTTSLTPVTPVALGAPASVSVRVDGSGVAAGDTVSVAESGTTLATATVTSAELNAGGATVPLSLSTGTSSLDVGEHTLVATYAGNAQSASSTSASTALVVQVPTTTTATTPDVNAGVPGVLSVSVHPDRVVGGASVGGTVSVSAVGWSAPVTASVADGAASVTLPALNAGDVQLTVTYSGSGAYAASSTTVAVTVAAAVQVPTATTVTVPGSPPADGAAFSLSATVSPDGATGSVGFTDGATALGSAPLTGGAATLVLPAGLSVGTHTITASYVGDATHAPSASQAASLVVTAAPTPSSTLTASPVTGRAADGVVLTLAVVPTSTTGTTTFTAHQGAGTPVTLGSVPLISGSATLTTAALGVGDWTVEATLSCTSAVCPAAAAATLHLDGTSTSTPDQQSVTVDIPAGALTITTPWTAEHPLDLGSLVLDASTSTFRLAGPVTFASSDDLADGIKIVNTRSGSPHFSLQVEASDFSSVSGSFPASAVGLVDVAAHQVDGNGLLASDIHLDDVGTLSGSAQTVAEYGGTSLGTAWLSADLMITGVPSSTSSGTYTGTVTFTAF